MLHIVTLVLVKAFLLISLISITPITAHRVAIYITGIVTMVWGITSIFIIAFQCPSPKRWNVLETTCINIRSARTYMEAMNILTDIALMVIPSVIIIPIKLSWGKRLTILGGFWFRIA
ncbi:hypothetical protein F5B20DRAFT_476553 [Whalleya microplaca]|nr:hypothetical protein F5B20DRAFT_476553 [Whalleya microplaca]